MIIPISLVTGWSILGFRRGMQQYDYKYNKNNKDSYGRKETYLYSSKILTGLLGISIYINPLFFLHTTLKEIYRLEVNIRKLENEKDTNYYHDLI